MADEHEEGAQFTPVESAELAVVRVGGEIDIDRAPLLGDVLHNVITQADGPDEIVVDLDGLTFCDSAGLNAFVRAHHLARQHGRRLRLHAPRPQVVQLLEMSGVDQLFQITPRRPAS
ncbi:STAS domain-containing protein [Streptomyces sp. NPDC058611]|uniref:STAS domain-containing protein n=1 Tax=unclassified Streptomyces TaxID=2593676 RepID=UPI0036471857